jgi:hypothetical protein
VVVPGVEVWPGDVVGAVLGLVVWLVPEVVPGLAMPAAPPVLPPVWATAMPKASRNVDVVSNSLLISSPCHQPIEGRQRVNVLMISIVGCNAILARWRGFPCASPPINLASQP